MKIADLKVNNLLNPICIDMEEPDFSWRLEGIEEDVHQLSYHVKVVNPLGQLLFNSGTVLSQEMMNITYRGEKLESNQRYFWNVECEIESNTGIHKIEGNSYFETGFLKTEDWMGSFIGEIQDFEYHLYQKGFPCLQPIQSAKLFICGLGHFECYLNEQKVSDYVLEPGWSDYNKTCFYTAYDVKEFIELGENSILVKLGDGMFHVPGGRYVYYERSYGKSKLLCQLEIVYEDGRKEHIYSDSTWRMKQSPISFCCMYGGEDYDGRLWTGEYLNKDNWNHNNSVPAVCVEPPKGELKAMPMESMKVMEVYEPVKVTQTEKGTWIYDFGTNFSGWTRIKILCNGDFSGQKIVMTPGELLDKEGHIDQHVTGKGYQWTYSLNQERKQEFAPDFTYTGFRYVEISGAVPEKNKEGNSNRPILELVLGEFLYPMVEKAGEFQCSKPLFNQIHKLVLQAILSNTKSYFTDCPHREKLGWMEQTHLIGPSIMYNLNVANIYYKIQGDMKDSQRKNGLVSDVCPEYVTGFEAWHEGFVDSPEWGSACIVNPWYLYKRYGTLRVIQNYYPMMKQYLNYLLSKTHHEVLHHGLGDWLDIGPCAPHSQNTPIPIVATCILYYDLTIMKKIASLLGNTEDEQEYAERMIQIYKEYNLQFLDKQTGRYGTGSQSAQAMSLMVGLVPTQMQEKVILQLKEDIVKRKCAITAGDIGHPFLIAALMKYGLSELLNEMTNITDTPGYGYQVKHGATTLTEEWDGPDPNKPHGSQNHLMLGSIEEWFYGGLAGIELIKNQLKFGEVSICPQIPSDMDWVKAWVSHPYGKIAVEWKKEKEYINVDVIIPPNMKAYLKDSSGNLIKTVGSGRDSYSFMQS